METIQEIQKKIVISREPSTSAQRIFELIQKFDNLSLADFPNMDEVKRQHIQEMLSNQPNAQEQQEWQRIEASKSNNGDIASSEALLQALTTYIHNWDANRPAENHVDEAKALYAQVEGSIKQYWSAQEENDWNNLDLGSNPTILDYLAKYPHSSHMTDIDDLYWENLNKENIAELDGYISNQRFSRHKNDATQAKRALIGWDQVKQHNDVLEVSSYIKNNPTSPFIEQAKLLQMNLKQLEIQRMKTHPNEYKVETMSQFFKDGIFSDFELISQDVLTENVLDTLRDPEIIASLPDIQDSIDKSIPECKEGFTDVYFFGIPSTGKTCILMGLSASNALHINLAHGGGEYAAALQQYVDAGVTVPSTRMGTALALEATMTNRSNNTQHKVNLVEMAGEDFARKIAGNQEHVYDFDSMGAGVTELLKNDNKKVFFLIIDPSTNVIRYNRVDTVGYDENGNEIKKLVKINCNQQTLITRMVDLFAHPSNAEIMKKVDSIHIIVTKADLLDENIMERDTKAREMFNLRYKDSILYPLMDLCKEYNINVRARYCPKLYTFSLGKFYVGGLFEYDATDSNKLVAAISNATETVKKKSFWDKLKETVN